MLCISHSSEFIWESGQIAILALQNTIQDETICAAFESPECHFYRIIIGVRVFPAAYRGGEEVVGGAFVTGGVLLAGTAALGDIG